MPRPAPGTLYLVPNLLGLSAPDDVLPTRTLTVARQLSHFVVETPKAARAFLKTVAPDRAVSSLELVAADPVDAADAQCRSWLAAGIDVGVLSDAGCPGMADPGAHFVSLAHALSAPVVPLVGPSSLLLGLMASGLDGQHFTFHGYLPAKPDAREAALRELDRRVQTSGATQMFIETPYRNDALLNAILAVASARTVVCAAQALSTADECVISKPRGQWTPDDRARLAVKQPTLFLLGKAQ
ncbi:MAG: SAM-dependent methyltransferase [Burkholderiales bacterium]|nr:SAM-dependent methyltransferase [Burkholderiales bacterium]